MSCVEPASRRQRAVGKHLAYVLRHDPASVGVTLDVGGWVAIEDLLAGLAAAGRRLTREQLDEVVAADGKQRYAVSADGERIRANQGHSVPVDLGLVPVRPPDLLFHGTVAASVPSILEHGLRPGSRQHVHLSGDVTTARVVGSRRGSPVVLQVAAGLMYADRLELFRSANGVWLTAHVPPAYVSVRTGDD
jgi:putative RNA 2'-phosphotransferase